MRVSRSRLFVRRGPVDQFRLPGGPGMLRAATPRPVVTLTAVLLLGLSVVGGPGVRAADASPTTTVMAREGLSIQWPATASDGKLRPGSTIAVSVRRLKSGPSRRRVRLSIARIDRPSSSGRTKTVSATATVGILRARLSKQPGARYSVRVRVGDRMVQRRLQTRAPTAPPTSPPTSPPVVAPGPTPPVETCPSGVPAIDASYVPTTGIVAGTFGTYTVRNTGSTCLGYGLSVRVERLMPDGAWVDIPESAQPSLAIAVTVRPGQTISATWHVPTGSAPGRYRLVPSPLFPLQGSTQAPSSPVQPPMFEIDVGA